MIVRPVISGDSIITLRPKPRFGQSSRACGTPSHRVTTAKALLEGMSPSERNALRAFLIEFIGYDLAGYVLLGSKPATICAFKKDSAAQEGLTWFLKHKEHLLPSGIHLSVYEKDQNTRLFLFREHPLLERIARYQVRFHKTLGGIIPPEAILEALKHPKNGIFHRLIDNDETLGLLLGYGPKSVDLYKLQERLFDSKSSHPGRWVAYPSGKCGYPNPQQVLDEVIRYRNAGSQARAQLIREHERLYGKPLNIMFEPLDFVLHPEDRDGIEGLRAWLPTHHVIETILIEKGYEGLMLALAEPALVAR